MKKLIVAAFLVVGFTTFAQVEKKEKGDKEPMEKMSPEKRGEREVKRMTKDLGLKDSQQKEMKALFSEIASKKGEGDNRPSKEDRKAMKDKISKILTPEQNAKWEKIQTERKEKMKERRDGKGEKAEKTEISEDK
jgi:Spy/CpxP family protein refolding chaperone